MNEMDAQRMAMEIIIVTVLDLVLKLRTLVGSASHDHVEVCSQEILSIVNALQG